MWHHPVFGSGEHGNDARMAPARKTLDETGVEIALVGHDHERFALQTSTGTTIGSGAAPAGTGSSAGGTDKLDTLDGVRSNDLAGGGAAKDTCTTNVGGTRRACP